jgi:threonine aldolase
MPNTPEQRHQLRQQCELIVPGFATASPAEEFRRMAQWCEANTIEHDHYGQGRLIAAFEQKVAALLGKPAAAFMPSGIMAQLAAVRIWTEAARVDRFGMHPTAHLAHHEEEAYAALLHCHGVPLGDRLRPMLASDLEACRQPLACAIVELPIREAGGQLPSWDELESLKASARQRGVRLHMDGARLWESAAHYRRSHAEIAEGFDSVYVSVYKGIGALSGALLAGSEDFVANARLWRRRMGGTLYHLSPMVVSAAMRFDERIALMPALYERTLDFAASLAAQPALRMNPAVPHTNMLHLHFDASADAVLRARDELAATKRCWLIDGVQPSAVPGWSVSELYVGDRLLQLDNARVLPLFAQLCKAMRGG